MTVTAGTTATDLTARLSPDRIMQVGFGFWTSRALRIRSRHGADLLDGLVSLGLLDRSGEGATATYANTAETAAFLDETSPTYVGGILEMAGARLYRFWGGLTEGLLTGEPQNETRHGETPMFEELYRDPDRLEQFMRAMSGLSRPRFQALADVFDFARHGSVADIGGAAADLAVVLAERHPHLRLTTFDLPVIAPIATRSVAAAGLSDRVSVVSGDFFRDALPRADVLTMGMILHDWDLEAKLHLLRAAYDALPPGGALVAVESLIDDARRENTFGLMMSLNMLIEFGGAFDYTGADFDGWCRSVGFARTEVLPLVGGASAAVAYR